MEVEGVGGLTCVTLKYEGLALPLALRLFSRAIFLRCRVSIKSLSSEADLMPLALPAPPTTEWL